MTRSLALAALLSLLLPALPARAEAPAGDLPANLARPGPAQPAGGPVTSLLAALALYDTGAGGGAAAGPDALDLAVAARLAAGIEFREATGWSLTTTPATKPETGALLPAPPGGEAAPAPRLDLLLSDEAMAGALMMADEDDALADVLYALPPVSMMRPHGGVSQMRGRLKPGGADSWQIVFPGRSPAELAVLAESDLAARWRVEDAAGHPVCPWADAGALGLCAFTPAANGFFRVVIENPGKAEGGYRLISN